MNGSGSNADTNVVFNTSLTSIATGSTITLTKDSTRPQSVWYTVSASGQNSDGTGITQVGYELTKDENNNIFAVNADKIAGTSNGVGGVGGVSNDNNSIYTTAVGGRQSESPSNNGANGTAVAAPSTTLKTGDAGSADITLSQNYLPLGITANVKDAYFNHNGII